MMDSGKSSVNKLSIQKRVIKQCYKDSSKSSAAKKPNQIFQV